jgi:hypothetical protein
MMDAPLGLRRALRAVVRAGRDDRPPSVVCLCGSTRFKAAFEEANRRETLAGRVVLSVGVFGHCEADPLLPEVKTQLDALHLKKIDLAQEILVINVNGYIGDSTRREIAYATRKGKRVRYLVDATSCVVPPVPVQGVSRLPQPATA